MFLVRLQVCAERPQGVGYGAVLRLQVLGARGYLFDAKSPTCDVLPRLQALFRPVRTERLYLLVS